MRLSLACGLLVLLAVVPATPASAQVYEPHKATVAIGGDIGFYVGSEDFNVAWTPEAYFEFYPLSRLSIRLLGGWARPEYRDLARHLDHWRGSVSLNYNWEAGYWHPFLSAGIGAFSIQYRVGNAEEVARRYYRGAFNVGGGVEYFWAPKIAVKFEIDYYGIRSVDAIRSGPAGLALNIGLKRYF